MKRLDGRIAVITGGGRGIGRATAERFAQEGAKVVIATRSEEPVREAVAAIEELGGEALLLVGDSGDRDFSRETITRTAQHFGSIDIVLHNAAYTEGGWLDTTDDEHIDTMFRTGLMACFWLTTDALPYLKQSKVPRILVTSSIDGNKYSMPGRSHYCSMKAGVSGFIRSAATELAKHRITVNAVEPGLTLTDVVARVIAPDVMDELVGEIPLGRAVYAEEVAAAFAFLACDEAAMITGQAIAIDGGQVLGTDKVMAFDDH